MNRAKPPNHYIKKFHYDTIILNVFEFACKILEANRIVYGTDYPFDMGDLGKALRIPGLPRISRQDQHEIFTAKVKNKFDKLKI